MTHLQLKNLNQLLSTEIFDLDNIVVSFRCKGILKTIVGQAFKHQMIAQRKEDRPENRWYSIPKECFILCVVDRINKMKTRTPDLRNTLLHSQRVVAFKFTSINFLTFNISRRNHYLG